MTLPSKSRSIHYATNVHHYDEALAAMTGIFDRVTLQRRFEPTPGLVDAIRAVPGSSTIAGRLERRVRVAPSVDTIVGLGAAQILVPAAGLFGKQASSNLIRFVNHAAAKATAKHLTPVDVFQFVEGLGHVALESARKNFGVSIMERRNLHHHVFEADPAPLLGFPQQMKLDPLRDFLDVEYAGADKIVVYSSVAKKSFVDRGFDPSKIVVIPLAVHEGVAPQSDPPSREGGRAQHDLLYVGRGDAFKGLDVAVAATALLGTRFKLRVAGPASSVVVEWLAGFDHVEYLGVQSRSSLQQLYRTSGALLAPSVESFGLAIIDAAAAGLPIIARETTGAAEFLPAEQCTVVEGRDPEKWAAAVLHHGETVESAPPSATAGLKGLTQEASIQGFAQLLAGIV